MHGYNFLIIFGTKRRHDPEGCGALRVPDVMESSTASGSERMVDHRRHVYVSYFVPGELPESSAQNCIRV